MTPDAPSPTRESRELRAALNAARLGSSDVVGRILEAYRPYLLHIAQAKFDAELARKAGVSDIVQETMIEAHREFASLQFRGSRGVRGWLRRILLHNLADFRKRFRGNRKRSVEREVVGAILDSLGPIDPTDPLPTPSRQALAREEADRIRHALDLLTAEQREVVLLRTQDHLGFHQIAARMGRTEDAVRMLFRRAVDKLKRSIEESP